jgi:hypothetical protein
VLSITSRKGDLQEMSTEKEEAKEKPESAEKKKTKEVPLSTEEVDAQKKPKSAEKSEAKEKPESAEKKKTKEAPLSTEEVDAQEKPKSAEKSAAKEKPLEKMTVKDLREMAKEMPAISGVHGMKKEALIVAIKKVKGIQDEPVKKADASVAQLKIKIKALKKERQAALETKNKKMATIYKRRISRLKKKTRRKAA